MVTAEELWGLLLDKLEEEGRTLGDLEVLTLEHWRDPAKFECHAAVRTLGGRDVAHFKTQGFAMENVYRSGSRLPWGSRLP